MPYVCTFLLTGTECIREEDSILPFMDNTSLLTRFKLDVTFQSWVRCQHSTCVALTYAGSSVAHYPKLVRLMSET